MRYKMFCGEIFLGRLILFFCFCILFPKISLADQISPLVYDTKITSTNSDAVWPNMGVDSSGNAHIAWEDHRHGDLLSTEIYYSKLDQNGSIVIDNSRLTSVAGGKWDPWLAVDHNDQIHLVWWDKRDDNFEIYYSKLSNNGQKIVQDRRLTFDPGKSGHPRMIIDNTNNVQIAWEDHRHGDWEVYYTKLDNNGDSLVGETRLTFDPGKSEVPRLAVDSQNNIHLVRMDTYDGNPEIYYNKLDNNGNIVVEDVRVTSDTAWSVMASLGIDHLNNLHMVWWDDRDGNQEIYYSKLDKNGVTLVDDTRITSDAGKGGHQQLAIDSMGNVHVVWEDNRNGSYEIYYAKLDNNGVALIENTRLTYTEGQSRLPFIVVDKFDNVHIAWADNSSGYYDIFYTKFKTLSTTKVIVNQLYSEDKGSGVHNILFEAGEKIRINSAITIEGDDKKLYNLQMRIFFTDADRNNSLLKKKIFRNYPPGTYYLSINAELPEHAALGTGQLNNTTLLAEGTQLLGRSSLGGFIQVK